MVSESHLLIKQFILCVVFLNRMITLFFRPELLDCTARTSLDMLSKHYYQALASWVVFFVPENDSEIVLYNEFMHYLGEKQRAAVAKLDERTTMFLVPPSEFSEKVLKVPGRLSIAGVALRLENPIPNTRPLLDHYPDLHHTYHKNGDGLGSSNLKPMIPSLPTNFPTVHEVSSAEEYSYDRRNVRDQFEMQQSSSSKQQESHYYKTGKMADSVSDFRQFPQQPNVVPSGVHQLTNDVALDGETDPQKRLQATLQLAAALLQQIQGKGT